MFPLLSSVVLLLILTRTTGDGRNIKVLGNKSYTGILRFYCVSSVHKWDINTKSILLIFSQVAVDMDFSIMWESDVFAATKSAANFASKKYLHGIDLSVKIVEDLSLMFEKGVIEDDELSILLTIAPCNSTWRVRQKLKKETVLLVSITEADCPRLPIMEGLTIPLMNKEEQISQIILDLRSEKILQWKEANIIYDDSINSLLADRVVKVLSEEIDGGGDGQGSFPAISTGIVKLDESETEDTVQTQAEHFFSVPRTSKARINFLGFLKSENMEIILKEAQRLGLVNTQNHWLFCLSDIERNVTSYAPMVNEGGHVAFLYRGHKAQTAKGKKDSRKHLVNRPKDGHMTRVSVPADEQRGAEGSGILRRELSHLMSALAKSVARLEEAERELYSRVSEEEWEALRPTAADRRHALLSYLKESVQGGEEEVDEEDDVEWRVAAVVTWGSSTSGSAAMLLAAATWDPRVGLLSSDHVFPHSRHGFRGKRVQIVTFHNPPWSTLYLNDSGSIVERKGLIFDILDELARNLNFSYSLVHPKEDRGGARREEDAPGTPRNLSALAAGAVEIVRRGEALLGASAFVVSPGLESCVSATAPVAAEKHAFLTSRPQVLSRALIFMAPFAPDTWLCIAVSVLVMGPVLYWVHNLTPYYEFHGLRHKSRITRKAKRKLSIAVKLTAFDKIWKCLWYVYGALLQQGGIQVPMADSGRIVIGTWWLVVIVVMTTYCGNLVAFLTFPTVSMTISTLDDLTRALEDDSGGQPLSIGIIDEAADRASLKEAADSRLRYLSSTAQVHEPSVSKDDNRSAERGILDRVRRGGHVLVARLSHLQLLAEEDYLVVKRCDFHLGGETFLGENLVMIVAKNSPYLTLINDEIKKMHHGGLIQKWTSDSMPKKGLCKERSHERSGSSAEGGKSDAAKNREVKLDDMQGSFFVLFIGCFLALIAIAVEYAWHRREDIRQTLANKSRAF
ncbi:ionotropic receptor 93a [Ischnura elegans]|uniref:ionotropic receptor 93a n=1 Tax=Ischnura elegans TaxID=197161 RepID=UPI001ED868B7|nr:ionotropic receptor 93a [Ischnura elegans]